MFNGIEQRVKAVIKQNYNKNSFTLNLKERFSDITGESKTFFVKQLVDELNSNYTNISVLDLSFNGLKESNIGSLLELKYVKKIFLGQNNISESNSVELLVNLREQGLAIFLEHFAAFSPAF
jgi:hypothetical protein